jgi:guanine deaminase
MDDSDAHRALMRRAVQLSAERMRAGDGGPFGAVIVKDGKVIAEGWNKVTSTNDPTAHAEVSAIRAACEKLQNFSLAGCDIYTSCEPCPMCLAAAHWARMDAIYFGASAADAARAGFDDALLYEELRKDAAERKLLPTSQLLGEEAWASFAAWIASTNKIDY